MSTRNSKPKLVIKFPEVQLRAGLAGVYGMVRNALKSVFRETTNTAKRGEDTDKLSVEQMAKIARTAHFYGDIFRSQTRRAMKDVLYKQTVPYEVSTKTVNIDKLLTLMGSYIEHKFQKAIVANVTKGTIVNRY